MSFLSYKPGEIGSLSYLLPEAAAGGVAASGLPGSWFILDLSSLGKRIGGEPVNACGIADGYLRSTAAGFAPLARLAERAGIRRVWLELLPEACDSIDETVAAVRKAAGGVECIPVTGDYEFAVAWLGADLSAAVALKGVEAAGLVSADSIHVLYSAVENAAPDRRIHVWGGVGTPEAAAAFLGSGAAGVVFESMHWLTDLVGLGEEARERIRRLRYDNTTLTGRSTGTPWRFFDKGNSSAVRRLTHIADCLGETELKAAGAKLAGEAVGQLVQPWASLFSADELIPLGPEAAFAARFEARFGASHAAFTGFASAVRDLLRQGPSILARFDAGPAARELGVAYPIIQGGMTWITDNFSFARAVEESGALPTLTLGLRDRSSLERDFGAIREEMGGHAYSVNCLLLDENPFRDEQLAWIEATKPPFVTIAAGDPAFVKRFAASGIRVIYLAPTVGLLKVAARAGADFVVLEGNEAGGHVGENTTLTLAQAALDLRRDEPDLFNKTRIVLAGGVHDRRSAFRAAMLGAECVQMGTAYLATREIVETGALRPQYQRLILESKPGQTVLSGESIGLRVRSLKTPKLNDICTLERNFAARGTEESERRMTLEKVSVGTLFVAARGIDRKDGSALDDDYCYAQGQFMSGAVAGNIAEATSLAELHASVAAAPMAFPGEATPPETAAPGDGHERIAVTGMAAINSLGMNYEEIFEASINLRSGVGRVPADRWDHSMHLKPGARVPSVYTDVGAFMSVEVTRQDIRVSPQDFRTMADSTRLTLLLARQALEESGILDSVDGKRIAVITSQNSAETASTNKRQLITVYAEEIVDRLGTVVPMTPAQREAAIRDMRQSGLVTDDTTLTGRLNCTAAGHICNQFALNGPSYSVGAACASSLIALHCAMMLVRQGVIDAAVVGGGEETLTPAHYHEFSSLGSLAGMTGRKRPPAAHSRPFDRDRDGFVLGEGGAVIVIERESVAAARGADVHAYITGVGVCTNHLGIVESVSSSQQIALNASFADIPYGPEDVDLVECHGTSTNQGDREEVHALTAVYPKDSNAVLASFKSQIGHTLGASGLSSLIRGVMAMKRGVLPPTLNYETPDPEIGLEQAGFRVLTRPEPWRRPKGRPRRMQVNAFGFGGASIVVHLEGAPTDADTVWNPEEWTPEAAPASAESVSAYRVSGPFGTVLAATASLGRPEVEALLGTLGGNNALTPGALAKLAGKGLFVAGESTVPMAWMFSGQGGWYPGMGRELYETVPGVRETLDRFNEAAGFDLLDIMFTVGDDRLLRTRYQQPALFALEYAIAKHFLDAGAVPRAVAGHSLGEFTALCVAGVLSPEDAFDIVRSRGELMEMAVDKVDDPGGMIATDTPVDILGRKLSRYPNLFITNYNSPAQTVVGGPADDLDEFVAEVKEQGFRGVRLKVGMAFHSSLMAGFMDEFRAVLERATFHAPKIPVTSNVSGDFHPDDPAAILEGMVSHLESPVLWTQNVYALWEEKRIRSFLEMGPGDTLCTFVGDIFSNAECRSTCREAMERRWLMDGMAWARSRGYGAPEGAEDLSLAARPEGKAQPAAPVRSGPGDVLERVIRIIMDSTGYERDEIDGSMDIRQDLNIRSSRLPVIMDEAEQAFGLEFRIEDFIGVTTVNDLTERIADLMAGKPVAARAEAATATVVALGEPPRSELPVLRYEIAEAAAGPDAGSAIDIAGASVAVAHFGHPARLEQVAAWVRERTGLDALLLDLDGDDSPEPVAACQGLVVLLDGAGTADAGARLERVFLAMKALAGNRAKKFCFAVDGAPEPGTSLGETGEGVLGMLLAASMEYASTVFRFAAVEEGLSVGQALDRSLSGRERTVELIFRADGITTREPVAAPFEAVSDQRALHPGDVVLLTGGGRGVTAAIALSLATLGVRLVLMGRSPESAPDTARTLAELAGLGCETLYLACDVADEDAVRTAVDKAVAAFGRIDAVVHGAGIIRDGFLQLMRTEDFNAVVRVKLYGLKNVVRAASAHGLRLAVAFSSVAAWHGNVGQANYCAANRAMAAYLDSLATEGIAGKTLWLPPVDGVGMADDPDVKQLLDRKGMGAAYVPIAALSQLVRLETVLGGAGWTLFSRPVTDPNSGKRFPRPEGAGENGRTLDGLPMLDTLDALDLAVPELSAGRTISHARDPWLPDHRPYPLLKYPLFSAVMAVESFIEAAQALYPDFTPTGVRNVRFLDMIPCAPDSERRLRVAASGDAIEAGTRLVLTALSCRDVSPKGRQLDRWSACYSGTVAMAAGEGARALPEPVPACVEFLPGTGLTSERIEDIYARYTAQTNRYRVIREITGAGERGVAGTMVYGPEADFGAGRAAYLYSPYLLEALMQLTLFQPMASGGELQALLPVGIGDMAFARRCEPGERITLRADLRDSDDAGKTWDAAAFDEAGRALMVVHGLIMHRIPE